MSKKNRLPAEESFTLQFGDPNESEVSAEEVFSPDDPEFDDQFMWRSATASLIPAPQPSEARSAEHEVPDRSEQSEAEASTSVPDDPVPLRPVEMDAEEEHAAPQSDHRNDTVHADGASNARDLDDPLGDMPEVIDERQAEMVRAPRDAYAARRFDDIDPSSSELRETPDAAIVPKVPPVPASLDRRERHNRVLFDNEPDLPPPSVLASARQGNKAPWVLYGTLGLGVAVLGIAFVGMTLELTKPGDDEPAVEVAAVAERVLAPQDNEIDGPIAAQMKVYRLAVGPFFDANSRVEGFSPDTDVARFTPAVARAGEPDQAFVANIGFPAPASVPAQAVAAPELEAVEDRVVTLGEDRIEIDLTDGDSDAAGPSENADAQASVTIDPAITPQKAPALVVTETDDATQSPAQEFAAVTLYEQTLTLAEEIELQADFLASQSGVLPEPRAPQLIVAALGETPKTPDFAGISVFSLRSEIFSAFAPVGGADQPTASLLVASSAGFGDAIEAPDISGFEFAGLDAIKSVAPPVLPSVPQSTDLAIAAPEVDISRELIAERMRALELEARQVDGYLARAGAETTSVIADAARLEAAAAQLQADAAKAALQGFVPATTQAEPAKDVAPTERISAITPIEQEVEPTPRSVVQDVSPVPRETVAPASTPQPWLKEAQWIPAFDLAFDAVETAGRPELEISSLGEADFLPGWVGEGSRIVSVGGVAASSEAIVMRTLLELADRQAKGGSISVNMEIRARAALDPRDARIVIPVWRRVVSGDGTVFAVRPEGEKWVARVQTESADATSDLKVGDILLRDVATKSRLASALALEEVLAAMEAETTEIVEFAILREGALASATLSLQN